MFSSISKSFPLIYSTNPALILTRAYAIKTDVKTRWVRPKKIMSTMPEKSGDLVSFDAEKPDPQEYLLKYEMSEELKTANELVQSIFRLDNNKRGASVKVYREAFIKDIKRHDSDLGSFEVYIAKMTANIRSMQDYMEKFPKHNLLKAELKELIDKRKKYLRILRKWDYKRFEWLVEKLNIVYKPYPEEFHWITRKDGLRKLAKIQCDDIKQERLDEYRKELQSQQLGFLIKKIENLEFIRNEQVECKVPVTVTQEEIKEAKKQHESLKKVRDEEDEIEKRQIAKDDYEFNL